MIDHCCIFSRLGAVVSTMDDDERIPYGRAIIRKTTTEETTIGRFKFSASFNANRGESGGRKNSLRPELKRAECLAIEEYQGPENGWVRKDVASYDAQRNTIDLREMEERMKQAALNMPNELMRVQCESCKKGDRDHVPWDEIELKKHCLMDSNCDHLPFVFQSEEEAASVAEETAKGLTRTPLSEHSSHGSWMESKIKCCPAVHRQETCWTHDLDYHQVHGTEEKWTASNEPCRGHFDVLTKEKDQSQEFEGLPPPPTMDTPASDSSTGSSPSSTMPTSSGAEESQRSISGPVGNVAQSENAPRNGKRTTIDGSRTKMIHLRQRERANNGNVDVNVSVRVRIGRS